MYDDRFVGAWQNYSSATTNAATTSPVHGGADSIKVDAGAYQMLFLYHANFDSGAYTSVTFWINGGAAGGQNLVLRAVADLNAITGNVVNLPVLQANTWTKVTVPLASLGAASQYNFNGIQIFNSTAATLPTFYVDDVSIDAAPAPATIRLTVDAGNVIRTIDGRIIGLNTAVYDATMGSSINRTLLTQVAPGAMRYPGGSTSDEYDWQTGLSTTLKSAGTNSYIRWQSPFPAFGALLDAFAFPAYITVNYGSGTPEQAAAWVAYANGSPSSTLALGADAKGRDWKTVGYWAALRGASPLAADDGSNLLRAAHPSPYAIKYWEVGNENFGFWEHDEHGSTFSGTQHDPVTYAQYFSVYPAHGCRLHGLDPYVAREIEDARRASELSDVP